MHEHVATARSQELSAASDDFEPTGSGFEQALHAQPPG
jgi:hypothetical protein